MKSSFSEKTFIEALKAIVTHPEKAKKYLADKRITQLEKEIIKASLSLRDGKYQDVISSLEALSSSSQVVESQRFYFLASSYNNLSHFHKAIEYFNHSLELGHHFDIHFRDFSIIYSLIICHLNIKKYDKVYELFEKLQLLGAREDKEKIDLEFARFFTLFVRDENQKAEQLLAQLGGQWQSMSEHQKMLFLIMRFDLFVRMKKFSEANDLLGEFKKLKKFYSKGNFKFMKGLLNHLIDGQEIYLYERDFEGQSDLLKQVKIINCLRSGNLDEAFVFWKCLQQSAPDIYGDYFTYLGDTCLFSLCIEKNLVASEVSHPESLELSGSKEENLVEILKKRKGPVPKEEIFFMVYGHHPSSKEDLHKLAALIYLIRRKMKLEIKSQKGCYYLAS